MLHQLPHAGERRKADYILIQIFPDFIQGFQPVKQLHVLDLGQIAGKDLIEMVMGVDQTGVAEHMGAINGFAGGDIQLWPDGADEAILAIQVGMLQHLILVVAGDKIAHIANEQGIHTCSSFTDSAIGWDENSPPWKAKAENLENGGSRLSVLLGNS